MILRGDVLFRQGDFHHTMIVTDPKCYGDVSALTKPNADQSIEVIHAASIDTAVYRELIDIPKSEAKNNTFTFYRPVAPSLRNAVAYASLWAFYRAPGGKVTRAGTKVPLTRYSYDQLLESGADRSRYSGAQAARHSDQAPPFEFDALYRAFKWASRMRSAFSENRGTTCCAFITACFQASVIDHYMDGSYAKVSKGLELLTELRGEKLPKEKLEGEWVESGPKKKKIALGALREFSNPGGFSSRFDVNDYCKFVTKEILGREMTVEDMFPSALWVDAKFNYSKNFERMLAAPNSGFKRIL
ncbi:hypothetical protein [Trinickia sp. Y13]|uniref:hypothetical protein n=1 Tax=Trinickia sp. Y13 TaxID=2917807 RepID=UPI002404D959|nr:hypothetical protein [Trinickia sp. Y13]MDG0024570.1 hypothetical protein [Trinickia sp. Y13]